MKNKELLIKKLTVAFIMIIGIIIGTAIGTSGRVTYNASEFDKEYEEKLKLLENKSQEANKIKGKIDDTEKSIQSLETYLKEKE